MEGNMDSNPHNSPKYFPVKNSPQRTSQTIHPKKSSKHFLVKN